MDENNLNAQDDQGQDLNLVPDGGGSGKMPLKRKVAIGATVALVVAGLGGAWVTGAFAPKSEITKIEANGDSGKKRVSEKTEPAVDWTVKIEAEGVTADSSPLITRYVCIDGAEKGIEFYHATSASDAIEGKGSIQLTEGTWEITAIPIINPDGSITTPAGGGEQAVSGESKDSGSTEFTGETKPAGDVTQDDIDKVLDKVNEAVSKGDGTLTGDAGKDVVNKVTDNASYAPAADKEKVEEKKDAAADSAVKAEDKKTDAAKPSTGSGSAPSKSDSKPSSGSSSKPSHEHTWQAQYRNDPVYETRTRTVVDQDAWDETVNANYDEFRFSDGYVTTSLADAINHQDSTGCSYSIYTPQVTIHHDAVTHEEQYQVQTGTKQVLTGYRCSGCGATK
ncbi:hypothetical protein [Collinsella aerofaciens]|uniref:hypothetical protein n=1 Tax=Collinsella aerofaciens TaxID=74426 RepID=UPI00232B6753|nr:hypothetical protein [Collinsella aerofaciens]MDB1894659.1 hypothetical protein [Collinsella aerofaciens]MDB1898478.1 hypothetical protein [Collinsella aerofaciens]